MSRQFNTRTERKDETTSTPSDHDQIAEVAYQLWLAKGRPEDSAEEDWLRAEEEVTHRAARQTLTAA